MSEPTINVDATNLADGDEDALKTAVGLAVAGNSCKSGDTAEACVKAVLAQLDSGTYDVPSINTCSLNGGGVVSGSVLARNTTYKLTCTAPLNRVYYSVISVRGKCISWYSSSEQLVVRNAYVHLMYSLHPNSPSQYSNSKR